MAVLKFPVRVEQHTVSPSAVAAGPSDLLVVFLDGVSHDVDALACPCGGRLRFIALITDKETAQAILKGMGLPAEAPPVARARSPDIVDEIPPAW